MAQATSKSKPSMQRGVKILIASLSMVTTLGGWAWLAHGESPDASGSDSVQEITDAEQESVALAVEIPAQPLSGAGSVSIAPLPTKPLPSLAKLPVRGLRHVGDATETPPAIAQPQTQGQPQAPRERNHSGQQNAAPPPQNVAPPPEPKQPAPKPEPPPKPKRKTKSSK